MRERKSGEREEPLHHIIEAQQFSRTLLEQELFPLTQQMAELAVKGGDERLADRHLFNLFYEPSTRTRISFEMAMKLLGGDVSGTENARAFSSVVKGETLEDTIRILNGYNFDVIVLRYDTEGGATRASVVSGIPVINAGDGEGQHPTQAVLDVYTIWGHFGKIDGLSVAMVGDLTYGRTVHSLAYLLGKFENMRLFFVSPQLLRIKEGVKEYLNRHNVWYQEINSIEEVAQELDVVYMTRAQTERMDQAARFDHKQGAYTLTREITRALPEDSIIMHPLPRNEELPDEVMNDPRVIVFRQAQNGLYIRMALLDMLLNP
ncbi:aspartate carbamoyltransferase [Candidatus Microgenomates bacterium]|nr:aspartate carbamoyltransferase [Candidatus Microgenomates bacterium]